MNARIEQTRTWLVKTPGYETEDRVFRLRALQLVDAPERNISEAVQELLQTQNEDGGWAQLVDRESDAYATGSVLVALNQSGSIATDNPAFRRGLSFLLATQQADGSWHVASRSKPFQTYFESGYPHGADQFISIAAAGWATTALALALPEVASPAN
jgi:squalene cyclase